MAGKRIFHSSNLKLGVFLLVALFVLILQGQGCGEVSYVPPASPPQTLNSPSNDPSVLPDPGSQTEQPPVAPTPNPPSACASPGTKTFMTTFADQTFAVPAGCSQVTVRAWGAGGGSGAGTSYPSGGAGGFSRATIAVTAGEMLIVRVGQGGYSGTQISSGVDIMAGGCGGGGSAVLRGGNVLIVAGGGGGGGSEPDAPGGAGGGTAGLTPPSGGGGGTQTAPGTGGAGPRRYGISGSGPNGGDGVNATGVAGGYQSFGYGNGGSGAPYSEDGGSGGGGGGYFGGGSGGGDAAGYGGGGGSGYVPVGGVSLAGVGDDPAGTTESGYKIGVAKGGINGNPGGNGLIVISWQ